MTGPMFDVKVRLRVILPITVAHWAPVWAVRTGRLRVWKCVMSLEGMLRNVSTLISEWEQPESTRKWHAKEDV